MGRRNPESATAATAGPSRPPRAAPKPTPPKPPKPPPVPYTPGTDPDAEEQQSVHEVYERIAPHFAQTRYKPWPLVERFLRSLPAGTLGLDSGAGNGKYLPTARDAGLEMIALDRSRGLLGIAREEGGGECVRGDLIGRPWREGVFDFAISIAAIHHLTTPGRRRQAVQDILHVLHLSPSPPYSRFMLYVWAFEQGHDSRRRMGAQAGKRTDKSADKPGSGRQDLGGVDEHASGREAGQRVGVDVPGDVPVEVPDVPDVRVQDVLVPWVMQSRGESSTSASRAKSSSTSTSAPAPAHALASASSSARQGAATTETHNSPPLLDAEEGANRAGDAGLEAGGNARHTAEQPPPKEEQEHQVFHRYYHLFLQGELLELVEQAAREEGFVLKPARAEGGGEGEGEGGGGRGGKRSGDGPREYLSAERRTRGDAAKWLRVVDVGWEADNWWLEGEVGVQSSV